MFQELMNKKIIKKRIRRNRKTLITGLIAVGVAVVIGVLCLCIALFMNSRAAKAEAAAAVPSPTPTPVHTTAPVVTADPDASPDAEAAGENAEAGANASGADSAATGSTVASTPKPATTAAGPTITKNPYSETVTAGGWVVFVAHATNYKSIEWRIVSEDAKTSYDMETAASKFGFWYTGADTDAITIGSVLLTLDGWQIQACFTDKAGNSSYTDFAQFHVVKATQW